MDLEGAHFFDTAMSVVARYGMKRTTMADIARAVGVSRQTLYDRFGDKDGVMAAGIDHLFARLDRDLGDAFALRQGLAAKLDAYFEIAVWPMYDLRQTMPDAADYEKGMGPASVAASARGVARKRAVLCDMLRAELPPGTRPPEDVAAFIEQSSSRAKMSDMTRDELERFLAVLAASVVALASGSGSVRGRPGT